MLKGFWESDGVEGWEIVGGHVVGGGLKGAETLPFISVPPLGATDGSGERCWLRLGGDEGLD